MKRSGREHNGYELVSFILQVIQVWPIAVAALAALTPSAWLVWTMTTAMLGGSWLTTHLLTLRRYRSPEVDLRGVAERTVLVIVIWPSLDQPEGSGSKMTSRIEDDRSNQSSEPVK